MNGFPLLRCPKQNLGGEPSFLLPLLLPGNHHLSLYPNARQFFLLRGQNPPLTSHHSPQVHCHVPLLGHLHPPPLPPSPAAALAERVEPRQAAVTLPARHCGLADAGAQVITLEVQGAWGGREQGSRGPRQRVRLGDWGSAAHSPAGWQSQGWQGVRGFQR